MSDLSIRIEPGDICYRCDHLTPQKGRHLCDKLNNDLSWPATFTEDDEAIAIYCPLFEERGRDT